MNEQHWWEILAIVVLFIVLISILVYLAGQLSKVLP
jgi:hypothetical protein